MRKQTDNALLAPKLALRQYFLDRYPPSRVLDCCQGGGVIWRTLRKTYRVYYVGYDLKEKKGRVKLDSVRALSVPGLGYDVIDIDTYGMPWKHWFNLLRNLSGDATIFLTIGFIRMGGGNIDKVAFSSAGLNFDSAPRSLLARPSIIRYATEYCLSMPLDCGFAVEEMMEAFPQKNARYIGVRLKKIV